MCILHKPNQPWGNDVNQNGRRGLSSTCNLCVLQYFNSHTIMSSDAQYILALNCGSSSIKSKLYKLPLVEHHEPEASLSISNIGAEDSKISIKLQWLGQDEKSDSLDGTLSCEYCRDAPTDHRSRHGSHHDKKVYARKRYHTAAAHTCRPPNVGVDKGPH